MKFFLPAALILFLFLCTGDCVVAGEPTAKSSLKLPAGTLTSEELIALFADATVHSVTAVKKRKSVSYYTPDGEVRQLRKGIKRIGSWRVIDNGRICLQMENLPEKCRIIVKEDGSYNKYIVKKNDAHQLTIHYTAFEKGNPLGL